MKTKNETKGTTLVGGRYRKGTAIATLFIRLQTGPKTVAQLTPSVKRGVDVKYRLSRIRAHGKQNRQWSLTRDGVKFTLKTSKRVKAITPRKRKATSTATKPTTGLAVAA